MRRIDARSGTENFKALFPTEFELLREKPTGGPFGPPLIRSRVKSKQYALLVVFDVNYIGHDFQPIF